MVSYSFLFFLDFDVTPAFSIPTINTIRLCVLSCQSCLKLVSRPRGASDPSSNPIRNICFYIVYDSRRIKLFDSSWFSTNKITIIFIRLWQFMTNKFFLFVRDDSRWIKNLLFVGGRFPMNRIFLFVVDDSRLIHLFLIVGIPNEYNYNYSYSSVLPTNKCFFIRRGQFRTNKFVFNRQGRFPMNKFFFIRRGQFPTNKFFFYSSGTISDEYIFFYSSGFPTNNNDLNLNYQACEFNILNVPGSLK